MRDRYRDEEDRWSYGRDREDERDRYRGRDFRTGGGYSAAYEDRGAYGGYGRDRDHGRHHDSSYGRDFSGRDFDRNYDPDHRPDRDFDREYDRDFDRGSSRDFGGGSRDFGDRMRDMGERVRRGWDRMTENMGGGWHGRGDYGRNPEEFERNRINPDDRYFSFRGSEYDRDDYRERNRSRDDYQTHERGWLSSNRRGGRGGGRGSY